MSSFNGTFVLDFLVLCLYNKVVMTIETLRIIFLLYLIAAFVLAIFYLRRCQLSFSEYALWGIFALVVPVLGPFLVILARPGSKSRRRRQAYRRGRSRRR